MGVHTGKKSKARNAGVCILPRHIEAGEMVNLKDRVFNLVVGRPVQFSLYFPPPATPKMKQAL